MGMILENELDQKLKIEFFFAKIGPLDWYLISTFQINEDVMLGKCPPIYHRSEPEADDANSDLDSDNQQAAVGE